MPPTTSRRELIKTGALAGVGFWVGLPLASRTVRAQGTTANDRLNIGIIGASGRGEGNLSAVASENIVALCDVDEERLNRVAQRFPHAAKYRDYRKLLERNDLDAVVVSTPDHSHALPAVMAMRQGLHVYCEKPLTHSIYEARVMSECAARYGVATQMGNQGHSNSGARRTVELIRAGVIGPIREVHAWTDRPIWPQGIDRPTEMPPVPATLDWDLWLGPAPQRPYHSAYHPFRWRGWWDFGTGALGDMACHVLDVAFWALDLRDPLAVEAEGPPPHPETAPQWTIIRYEFAERTTPYGVLPPCRLTWYDGGKRPPTELFDGERVADNGTLFIGEKGKIYVPDAYGARYVLLPRSQFEGFQPPPPSIPNSPGHHAEWLLACKTGSPTGSNFAYASALTETVLLGIVAYRVGKKIEWDPRRMCCTNAPEASRYLRREYRKGWEL